jgi:capsular exopolysaccharide synthesis family protein
LNNEKNSSYRDLSYDMSRTIGVGEGPMQRTFRDYLTILRERLWYVIIVFLVAVIASVAYVLSSTKQYTAVASIEILSQDAVVMKVQEVRSGDLRRPEDLNTQVSILESGAIIQKVAASLSPSDTKALMAPYQKGGDDDLTTPEEVLYHSRKVIPIRLTRVLQVAFTHPDPEIAARIANQFVEEYMKYNVRWRVDESMRAVEDLKVRADEQAKKVQDLGNALQEYRESHNMISLDQRKDIVTEKLKALNTFLTDSTTKMNIAEVQLNQVVECQKNGGNLAELPFIASLPHIQELEHQIDSQNVVVADLRQRYRDEHPKMLSALQSLSQSKAELAQALVAAAETIRNGYETAKNDVAQAKNELSAQETEALKLDRLSVDYGTQQNELNVNQELLSSLISRMRETSMDATIEEHNARVLDAASSPRKYSSPNVALDLAGGSVVGLALGLSLAFIIAFIDDRVKTSYQIEFVIGLPLVGIIPRTKKMDTQKRAQLIHNYSDPLASEAFRTIHSNIRLKPESKDAKVILLTSTQSGEGKSFITSNLAQVFAEHGERTIVVDCDLRKPAVHKLYDVNNAKGVIDYCSAGAPLESLIIKDTIPSVDLLPTGGRASNPTYILNSAAFPQMIAELRKRYDRIFIDSPPLAPVSDAMIIIPHVDGVLFTIRFNHVRCRGAKFCVSRIKETSIPCFGAILNGLDLALGEYYYAEYYDKAYRGYAEESAGGGTGTKLEG